MSDHGFRLRPCPKEGMNGLVFSPPSVFLTFQASPPPHPPTYPPAASLCLELPGSSHVSHLFSEGCLDHNWFRQSPIFLRRHLISLSKYSPIFAAFSPLPTPACDKYFLRFIHTNTERAFTQTPQRASAEHFLLSLVFSVSRPFELPPHFFVEMWKCCFVLLESKSFSWVELKCGK